MELNMSGWFVKSNDIKLWTTSNKRRAEEVLPLLVKNLIQASSNPKEIIFPSGDAVATGGWDGLLEVEEGNEFVPTGKSGWEFGTNSAIKIRQMGIIKNEPRNLKHWLHWNQRLSSLLPGRGLKRTHG